MYNDFGFPLALIFEELIDIDRQEEKEQQENKEDIKERLQK